MAIRIDGGRLIDILQEQVLKNGGALQGQAKLLDANTVEVEHQVFSADHIILATGAWLPHILEPLGYQVDNFDHKKDNC